MCRVIVDYVTGRGFERNNGTQAYSSLLGYQQETCYSRFLPMANSGCSKRATPFYWRKSLPERRPGKVPGDQLPAGSR